MQLSKRVADGGGSLETIQKLPRGTRKAFFYALLAKGTVADWFLDPGPADLREGCHRISNMWQILLVFGT